MQVVGDILDLEECVALQHKDKYFDVIVISFVLTSLARLPDFSCIVELMKEGGQLIIANAAPDMTKAKPYYDFEIDGKSIALNTVPVYPEDLMSILMKLSLTPILVEPINNQNGERYSNILIFEKK